MTSHQIHEPIPFYAKPLFVFIQSIVRYVADFSFVTVHFVNNIVPSVANVILTYYIGKRLYSRSVGLFAALLVSTHTTIVLVDRMAIAHSLNVTFVLLSFLVICKGLETKSPWHFGLSGVLLGLSVLIHSFSYVYLPVFVGFALVTTIVPSGRRAIGTHSVIALTAGIAAPIVAMELLSRLNVPVQYSQTYLHETFIHWREANLTCEPSAAYFYKGYASTLRPKWFMYLNRILVLTSLVGTSVDAFRSRNLRRGLLVLVTFVPLGIWSFQTSKCIYDRALLPVFVFLSIVLSAFTLDVISRTITRIENYARTSNMGLSTWYHSYPAIWRTITGSVLAILMTVVIVTFSYANMKTSVSTIEKRTTLGQRISYVFYALTKRKLNNIIIFKEGQYNYRLARFYVYSEIRERHGSKTAFASNREELRELLRSREYDAVILYGGGSEDILKGTFYEPVRIRLPSETQYLFNIRTGKPRKINHSRFVCYKIVYSPQHNGGHTDPGGQR